MTDFYLDNDTWDMVIDEGDWAVVADKSTLCAQAVLITLKAFKGTWFANIDYGVAWIANENNEISILDKEDKVFFDSTIRKEILSNAEVLSIISYQTLLNPETGSKFIAVTVESEEGPVEVTADI